GHALSTPATRLGCLPDPRPPLSLDSMIKRHALSSRAERPRRGVTLAPIRGKQTPPLLVILPLAPQSIRIRRRTTVHTRTTTSHRTTPRMNIRSEEHTSELQSRFDIVCRPRLE